MFKLFRLASLTSKSFSHHTGCFFRLPRRPVLRYSSTSAQCVPKWRNWQTRQIQGLVWATTWGFKSPLRHHEKPNGSRRKMTPVFIFEWCRRGDLNASPPPTNRRMSATYWGASGGRAGREGAGVVAGASSVKSPLPSKNPCPRQNPIRRRGNLGLSISSRIVLKMILNFSPWTPCLRSNSSRRRERTEWEAAAQRRETKARIIAMFT